MIARCSVIVRPLTHFTIFTDRVLAGMVSTIWAVSLVLGAASNIGVTQSYFGWNTTLIPVVQRASPFFGAPFAAVNFTVPTLIVMTCYTKIFLVVRRQVRSVASAGLAVSSGTIFGSSVRSAKNLFVICAAYWFTFLPVIIRVVLAGRGVQVPDVIKFVTSSVYLSSSGINASLYITFPHLVQHLSPLDGSSPRSNLWAIFAAKKPETMCYRTVKTR